MRGNEKPVALAISRSPAAQLVGLCALAAATRIYDLTAVPIWLDEANAIEIARHGVGEQLELLREDSAPPLYSVLLGIWMQLFGASEASVRMLSVLGGVALVGCTYWAGRRFFSPFVGVATGALMALSPSQIEYSQQARPYALASLACLLATYWFARALSTRRLRDTYACAIALLTALYLHYYALFLATALLIWWLRARGWQLGLRRNATAAAILLVGFAPWVPSFFAQWENREFLWWFENIWDQAGAGKFPVKSLLSFTSGPPWSSDPQAALPAWWILPVALVAALVTLAVVPRIVDRQAGAHDARASLWTATWVAPLGLAFASSALAAYPHYIAGRVDQLFLPAFLIVLCVGISRLRFGRIRIAILGLCLAYSSLGLAHHYGREIAPRTARELARDLARELDDDDTLIFTSQIRAEVEYYLRREGARPTVLSFPESLSRHKGNVIPREMSDTASLREALLRLRRHISGKPRLFVECGVRRYRSQAVLVSWLSRAYTPGKTFARTYAGRQDVSFSVCELLGTAELRKRRQKGSGRAAPAPGRPSP